MSRYLSEGFQQVVKIGVTILKYEPLKIFYVHYLFCIWRVWSKQTSRFEGSNQTLTLHNMKKDVYFCHCSCSVLFCLLNLVFDQLFSQPFTCNVKFILLSKVTPSTFFSSLYLILLSQLIRSSPKIKKCYLSGFRTV